MVDPGWKGMLVKCGMDRIEIQFKRCNDSSYCIQDNHG